MNGYEITTIENEIYALIVNILEQRKIPVDIGYVIMESVSKRFSDSAYYATLTKMKQLQLKYELLEQQVNISDNEDSNHDTDV